MKFFVPSIGTTFKLEEPWTFLLYVESRNETLFEAFGPNVEHLMWEEVTPYFGWGIHCLDSINDRFKRQAAIRWGGTRYETFAAARFSLPAGTILSVKRVYIRSGQKGEFDSITLSVRETTHPFLLMSGKTKTGKPKKSLGDFWVKLCDFNQIDATIEEDNVRKHK